MNKRVLFLLIIAVVGMYSASAQEIQARVSINAARVSSTVDRKVFQTLQNALTNFINNRKWTGESFKANEKIVCNFILNISEAVSTNVYKASLTVQAARPVYNASYETPLINYQDEAVVFKYVEFQPLEFNENRVAGTDALASNLTATIAYYAYLILGLDFDSFNLRGGDPYYQKVQLIVNNAPEARDITGWKAFDGLKNRYWLIENLVNNRYTIIHDAIYSYYRLGMDHMYENETEARTAVLNTLGQLNTLNNQIPNTVIIPFFFQGKATEIVRIFKKSPPEEKQKAQEILSKIDITNSNLYKSELR